jgi:hypothetical protein
MLCDSSLYEAKSNSVVVLGLLYSGCRVSCPNFNRLGFVAETVAGGGRLRNSVRQKTTDKMDKSVLNEIGRKGVDWIHPAQDRDHCRAFVNTVMNIKFP